MPIRYTDREINAFIREPKHLPSDFRKRLKLRDKRGHREKEFSVSGNEHNEFRIILRQNKRNSLDFSVILALDPPDTNQLFRLRRYNGKSHEHTNPIEKQKFYDFHVHMATERYQDRGGREDAYAEPSDRFNDFDTALAYLFKDCNFRHPPQDQQEFFGP